MDGAKGSAGCVAIDSRKMVTLASTTVVEDCLAAVLFAQRGKTFRHFRDRSAPVNLFEAPVNPPTLRLRQPMWAILIEVESMCLLACIALRCGMRVVTAHFHQVAAVFAAELDFDAAVALTQNAGCRFPVRGGRVGHNCHLIALLHEKASVEC
jgi:hypothetical protein